MNRANFLSVFLFSLAVGVGCSGGDGASAEAVALVTYIDRESGETVEAPAQPTPAVNPKTGSASLFRAGWCAECEKWYPLPPDRNPGQVMCKKHGTPLNLTGPGGDASEEQTE